MRGFGDSGRQTHQNQDSNPLSNTLPVPFNIPIVLQNILYEEIDLSFDAKLLDMLETVRFANKSQKIMQERYALREAQLQNEMLTESDNEMLKLEYEDIQLDRLQASFDFKDLVSALSDMMNREQFEKLLKFSNIPV